jgi:hypothetical protein
MSNGKLLGIKIDVTKLDKSRFFEGKNGAKYADLDIWINDEEDQFGYHASVNQSQTKEERDAKEKKIYVGNGKKLFGWDNESSARPATASAATSQDDGDDIPF